MQGIQIDEVTFHGARREQVERGLWGWAAFTIDGVLRLEGIAVRRTLDGRHALAFPARQTRDRRRQFWIRPLNDAARRDIEVQVLGAIGLAEEVRR